MRKMRKQVKNLILVETIIIVLWLILVILLKSKYIELIPKCIFKEKFGLLCPACNGTTFAVKLSRIDFKNAFRVHPIFFISVIYLGVLNIIYIANVLFKKNIKLFRWWHLIIWVVVLVIFTILRNIL